MKTVQFYDTIKGMLLFTRKGHGIIHVRSHNGETTFCGKPATDWQEVGQEAAEEALCKPCYRTLRNDRTFSKTFTVKDKSMVRSHEPSTLCSVDDFAELHQLLSHLNEEEKQGIWAQIDDDTAHLYHLDKYIFSASLKAFVFAFCANFGIDIDENKEELFSEETHDASSHRLIADE